MTAFTTCDSLKTQGSVLHKDVSMLSFHLVTVTMTVKPKPRLTVSVKAVTMFRLW